ncbi:MAG: DNA-formamidopyrimidine glycosylase [Candidatus Paceibacterota bacterium]|jgi:formamidopyrimidine-DNA glycosylase
MPELPEVETTKRGLERNVLGLTIKEVWTDLSTKDKRKKDTVANPKYFRIFKKEVSNKKILSVERRAKNILINLSPPSQKLGGASRQKTILIHLKMTGYLFYGKNLKIKFAHVIFSLSNKNYLVFSDMRKFGKITLLDTKVAHDSKHLNNIGPEPLDKKFTLEKFKEQLRKKLNSKIKTVLMDQSIIAGIGNIYSDEILWRAGVHPERMVKKIKEKELKLILKAIKETLTKGIKFGGDSMSDYKNIYGLPGKFQLHHEAYRRTGKKCRKRGCKGIIRRKIINGRSAHFCSVHQK